MFVQVLSSSMNMPYLPLTLLAFLKVKNDLAFLVFGLCTHFVTFVVCALGNVQVHFLIQGMIFRP